MDDDSDASIFEYFNSSGHRNRDIAAFLCALAAALFFVWFLSALVRGSRTPRASPKH